jgi:hypothetical protein
MSYEIKEKDGTFTTNIDRLLIAYVYETRSLRVIKGTEVLVNEYRPTGMTLPEFKEVVEKYREMINH